MEGLVRYGRGVDTTKLMEAGFEYRYTSAGAVESFARANNLRRATGSGDPAYRYEQDVEQFFRHSPRWSGASTPDRLSLRSAALQPAGPELGAADLPLLGGHGVADVVLPLAVDLEEPQRHALVA